MSIIHAHRDDWIPHNPRIRVGSWIGAIIAVSVIYIAAAAVIGHFIVGDGSPYLGS